VCVDKIIRYPHLDDLKSDISVIPFEESFSSFVDLFDKSNMYATDIFLLLLQFAVDDLVVVYFC
jgi:hypothetical protein